MRTLLYTVVLLMGLAGLAGAAANCPPCSLCPGQASSCCAPGICPAK
jgi:hypothetical protein